MTDAKPRWPLWGWWPLVVLALSVPLPGFTPHPQWDRVNLVPFGAPADQPHDIAGNVALFIPFGASFVGTRRTGGAVCRAVAAAGCISVVAEATQIFSTVRDPSATDVVSAMIGASLGAMLARRAA